MKRTLLAAVIILLSAISAYAYFTYPACKKVPQRLYVNFRTTPYILKIKNDVKNPYKENRIPRLFAVHGKKEVKILRPNDLLQIIPVLRSKQEVLSFVRLFTDGNTHGLFMAPGALEVFIADQKTMTELIDDNYGWGLIHPDRAQMVGVKPPAIKQVKGTYVVTRTLVFYPQPQKNLRLAEVTEHLGRRSYMLTESRQISEAPWVERLLSRRSSQ